MKNGWERRLLMNEYRQPAVPHAREIQVIFLFYLRQFVCKSIFKALIKKGK
jgi:hypothetical protein